MTPSLCDTLEQWITHQQENIITAQTILNHLNHTISHKPNAFNEIFETLTEQLIAQIKCIEFYHNSITSLFSDIKKAYSEPTQLKQAQLKQAQLQYQDCQSSIHTFAQAYYGMLQVIESETYRVKNQMIHTRSFLEQLAL